MHLILLTLHTCLLTAVSSWMAALDILRHVLRKAWHWLMCISSVIFYCNWEHFHDIVTVLEFRTQSKSVKSNQKLSTLFKYLRIISQVRLNNFNYFWIVILQIYKYVQIKIIFVSNKIFKFNAKLPKIRNIDSDFSYSLKIFF